MRVAVIGSGISGLVAAYRLSPLAEVHVFEADSHVGGHTNTIDVSVPSGVYSIDTGFIVFNDRTYPRFIALMNELNVPSQPSSMSFSVKVEKSGLEYNGTDVNRLFVQRLNLFRPSFHRMIRDILRFNREAPTVLEDKISGSDLSLDQYLLDHEYSREFIDHYIIPMGAAVWSASVERMKEFPVRTFVTFFKNHGMLSINDRPQWRVIQKGSRSYLPALTNPFKDRLHINTAVHQVRREKDSVVLTFEKNGTRSETKFDHVILAGHADQSLTLLADATALEREILSAFPYQENNTVLHTDTTVLPKNSQAWAAWNYLVPEKGQQRVAVTYDMNILQNLSAPETFLVSLNMEGRIDPKKILKKIVYHHPVYSARAIAAQKRWSQISGPDTRTHFCGAYWNYGFHEDGVKSGERVYESLRSAAS